MDILVNFEYLKAFNNYFKIGTQLILTEKSTPGSRIRLGGPKVNGRKYRSRGEEIGQ